ncbi:MAG: ChbG/HpnK family deacetylase, partial [candidate division NC10 bacterium]
MRRLIVNADDFGLTAGVSRGILEAHRRGIVTSTTLIANRPLDGALLDGLKVSRLGVGLHLNLTLGEPVSPAEEIPSLLDAGGKFFRDPLRQAAEAKPEEVELELRAQVATFIRLLGRKPTHLDSHHHVGRHLPIRDIVFALAEELGIPLRCQDAETRRAASERGLRSPEHFFGESGPEAYWSSERLLSHLATLPDGVSEFMTHPGCFDQDLVYSRYGRQR